jgi:hypothetical protein
MYGFLAVLPLLLSSLVLCVAECGYCIEAKNSKIHISDPHMRFGVRRDALLNPQFSQERICFPC